jgi:hypothetical protein
LGTFLSAIFLLGPVDVENEYVSPAASPKLATALA